MPVNTDGQPTKSTLVNNLLNSQPATVSTKIEIKRGKYGWEARAIAPIKKDEVIIDVTRENTFHIDYFVHALEETKGRVKFKIWTLLTLNLLDDLPLFHLK